MMFTSIMPHRFLAAILCLIVSDASASADSIFVARRGWHIDVGFAVDELEPPMAAMASEFPGGRYVFFGLGDRRYLTARRHGVPQMLRAIWPGEGLILMTGLKTVPAAAFGADQVIELHLSREQSARAQAFVWKSLTVGQREKLENGDSEKTGPYSGSVHLDTGQPYSALHTCNTWAAETVSSAGVRLNPRGVVFASQMWRKVEELAVAGDSTAAVEDAAPLRR